MTPNSGPGRPESGASGRKQHGISVVRLEVREDQAAVVRRILTLYAGGNSLEKIAKQLNAEGVISPQLQKGRISRSWCPSSIRTILRNDRYRGRVVWGKTLKIRLKAGKRIYKRTTSDKWVVRDIPEQRIISEDLWHTVQVRIETVNQVYREIGRKGGMQGRSVSSPYLFSGLLECAVCCANISIVRGSGADAATWFMAAHRTHTGARRFAPQVLEGKLLDGLQEQVMRPEVIDYVLAKFEAELPRRSMKLGEPYDWIEHPPIHF